MGIKPPFAINIFPALIYGAHLPCLPPQLWLRCYCAGSPTSPHFHTIRGSHRLAAALTIFRFFTILPGLHRPMFGHCSLQSFSSRYTPHRCSILNHGSILFHIPVLFHYFSLYYSLTLYHTQTLKTCSDTYSLSTLHNSYSIPKSHITCLRYIPGPTLYRSPTLYHVPTFYNGSSLEIITSILNYTPHTH